MGTVAGGWTPLGAGFSEKPVCFWGIHAVGFNLLVEFAGVACGFLGGMLVGLIVAAFVPDPEPLTHGAIVAIVAIKGAKIGAVVGACLSAALILASRCSPCGFCFCLVMYSTPWGAWIPVVLRPCTRACPLIPPGCP